jgi:hypothetical protein
MFPEKLKCVQSKIDANLYCMGNRTLIRRYVAHAAVVWNACPDLRKAVTRGEARKAVAAFAASSPI